MLVQMCFYCVKLCKHHAWSVLRVPITEFLMLTCSHQVVCIIYLVKKAMLKKRKKSLALPLEWRRQVQQSPGVGFARKHSGAPSRNWRLSANLTLETNKKKKPLIVNWLIFSSSPKYNELKRKQMRNCCAIGRKRRRKCPFSWLSDIFQSTESNTRAWRTTKALSLLSTKSCNLVTK